ncbi:MAG: 50S ribosomal protein L29 [Holosporaceae bacterium]|jgi:ribosomal protein L29|nr:50S ribosomal protein L29 [Holosporaceae bacterium]
MVKKEAAASLVDELEAAKMEMMRIRFRRILGESVPAHRIKNVRKDVAKCVRLLHSGEGKNA